MNFTEKVDNITDKLLHGRVEDIADQDKGGVRLVSMVWMPFFACITAFAGYRLGIHVTHPDQLLPITYNGHQLWGSALEGVGNCELAKMNLVSDVSGVALGGLGIAALTRIRQRTRNSLSDDVQGDTSVS